MALHEGTMGAPKIHWEPSRYESRADSVVGEMGIQLGTTWCWKQILLYHAIYDEHYPSNEDHEDQSFHEANKNTLLSFRSFTSLP